MTRPRGYALARAGASALLALCLAAAALPGGSGDQRLGQGLPTLSAATLAAAASTDTQVQRVRVKWRGTQRKPTYVKTAVIPGIGDLDLVCRPKATMIRLYASDRSLETQMWMQKYEVKNGQRVVAVKNARIYRYAHANDDGTGGTGASAHEGLNQRGHIENRSQDGYMYGVISQRAGRHQSGASLAPRPVTTFELNWFWNGFDHPRRFRFCQIDATFTTQFDSRAGITWHGDDDRAPTVQTQPLPGIGSVDLRCDHGVDGQQTLAIRTDERSASLYVERVFGEGPTDSQVESTTLGHDRETGLLGPYPLPRNGSLRVRVTSGGTSRWMLVSSYLVLNNPIAPRNLCEVAAGYYGG